MRTKYTVCEMEGNWYVVKDYKILSYEKFSNKEGAQWYADAMNGQVDKLRQWEEKIKLDVLEGNYGVHKRS